MFRQYMFVIFGVLSTMCFATSLLFTHRFPLLVKHMPQESDGTANFILSQRFGKMYPDYRSNFNDPGWMKSSVLPEVELKWDNLALVIPQWRTRRAQPVIDYTDDFSADPFEVLLKDL
ncbi:hypothetical protein DICVIV_03021 [Dictyocaulus viviparus]|uniref:Uncharacterized protein n=1 Tax=Dictyocaulus viviparus TaxID=29172 RepID=A0A0D8Y877_DICVI|nr:hypothetical protein DICVIV_03021 [Dictyocaulus viviparus]